MQVHHGLRHIYGNVQHLTHTRGRGPTAACTTPAGPGLRAAAGGGGGAGAGLGGVCLLLLLPLLLRLVCAAAAVQSAVQGPSLSQLREAAAQIKWVTYKAYTAGPQDCQAMQQNKLCLHKCCLHRQAWIVSVLVKRFS
jgi:hypothetical protein